jgi:hypothetical protein
LAGRDGSKWPQCNNNQNTPTWGNKWWPILAGSNGSKWLQRDKCGQDWPGARAANGRSAIKGVGIGSAQLQQMAAAQ